MLISSREFPGPYTCTGPSGVLTRVLHTCRSAAARTTTVHKTEWNTPAQLPGSTRQVNLRLTWSP